MNRLAWRLAVAAGWGRPVLLASCTAVVSGLLLVAVAVLSLPEAPAESLFGVIADSGTRGGYAFGTVLLTLPLLRLLYQAIRLGTSARERRLAALRRAGATPAEVRRIGAVEVGIPALAGAFGGRGQVEQGGRRSPLPQPEDDRAPPGKRLPQARVQISQRARPGVRSVSGLRDSARRVASGEVEAPASASSGPTSGCGQY
jgi:hypothetical protein